MALEKDKSIGPDKLLKAPPWNGVEPDEVARQLAKEFHGRVIGVLFPNGLNVTVGVIKKCEVDGSGEVLLIIDQIFRGENGEATVCSGSIKLQIKADLPSVAPGLGPSNLSDEKDNWEALHGSR